MRGIDENILKENFEDLISNLARNPSDSREMHAIVKRIINSGIALGLNSEDDLRGFVFLESELGDLGSEILAGNNEWFVHYSREFAQSCANLREYVATSDQLRLRIARGE